MAKKPGIRKSPPTKKKVRAARRIVTDDSRKPCWRISSADTGGPWSCAEMDHNMFWTGIFHRIRDFETMTWHEIRRTGSHSIPVSEICHEAGTRLEEIGLGDTDELFSLRLSGKQRLWGIRDRETLRILWWDPEHQICPSAKKHT
ncbi:hypothetical protein QUF72_02780 [Desulfobacterales bacterium HSG2]|nr:hypothetical protein [Desulfobacterales bacterium HSG2]